MLEAGRKYVPERETPMFQTPDQAPLRGARQRRTKTSAFTTPPSMAAGRSRANPTFNPRTIRTAASLGGARACSGGRTNHWGRISLRNGPYDFKPHTRDGLGFDWPISYEDVAPYYDKVERLIGVYGTSEGLENTPNSSPGLSAAAAGAPGQRSIWCSSAPRRLGIPIVAGTSRRAHAAARFQALARAAASRQSQGAKDHRRRHAATRRLFLGHRLRSRLLDPGELSVDHGAPAAGARHRQSRHRHRCDGAGKSLLGTQRPRQGRDIHRQG